MEMTLSELCSLVSAHQTDIARLKDSAQNTRESIAQVREENDKLSDKLDRMQYMLIAGLGATVLQLALLVFMLLRR